jgi:hypothetical protein
VRLDNPKIVERHLRSYLLERLESELPSKMGQLLDDLRKPTRWNTEDLEGLRLEIRDRRNELVAALAGVMEEDRRAGRTTRFDESKAAEIVEAFVAGLVSILEGWWERVRQLDREFQDYSTVGSPRQDEKKASARKRAYYEITQDPERAYTLNYLSTRGFLPAYQFPVDTFTLEPGVADTPTLFRPAAIAIEEFAPGNFVYANGRKLRSIRVLFPGGPGSASGQPGRTDAETSGRLQAFHFCENCDEAVEAGANSCARCGASLAAAAYVVFVDAFEAEENLKIGSEEESRQRQNYERRENVLARSGSRWRLFPYPLTPIELTNLADILVTNWGRVQGKVSKGNRFWLCPDCGRHLPYDPNDPQQERKVREWRNDHARFCAGEPAPLVLAYRFSTDELVLSVPSRQDAQTLGRSIQSPTMVTLAESLLAGAAGLLELEANELAAFVRRSVQGSAAEEVVFYETVPGGAGYLEEMARRLPEVAASAMDRLYGHSCRGACYLCLKHYRNQRWHPFFDKELVRDLLLVLSKQDAVPAQEGAPGVGAATLARMLQDRESGQDPSVRRYPKGEIEEPLRMALEQQPGLPPGEREYEVRNEGGVLVTVPDFAWPDVKLAVYCDGFAFHGDRDTLELDARKRNFLVEHGWVVLTYWGRTILKDPNACAGQIALAYRQRVTRSIA